MGYNIYNNSITWIEDYLGIKLEEYQKLLLKQIYNNNFRSIADLRKTQCLGLKCTNMILDEMRKR
ncbi:TPA: hypothetical protein LA460_000325 [Clostridium botulinum]|nr:hypothetical protein [Clostridium botulinum]HBJ1652929.1 hypothetical protein [Clostridium botulinum]